MSYDVHVGRNKGEATRVPPSCRIDEETHRRIFDRPAGAAPPHPLLDRMRDLYRDAVYHPSELELLDRELGRMAGEVRDAAVRETLARLRAVCREAEEGGLRVFLVSD